ncbi:Hsp20/alpha crystallin family protein [Taklimakanibacter deserti]|uniref:Hsp20/alpha crystallin family protein n=1 Tax=Taklimakanibacter deserti TaxID=2267839 RepID=UPI000E65DB55
MTVTKLPVTKEAKLSRPEPATWHPLLSLQREINQIFDQFDRGWRPFSQRFLYDTEPSSRVYAMWSSPAVDIVDTEKAYEITVEVPGMTPENLEVKAVNGRLVIKGEKKESKQEKRGDTELSERCYGAFERSFQLPEGVDSGKIEATLEAGVLTVLLPKSIEVQKSAKKIEVKAA